MRKAAFTIAVVAVLLAGLALSSAWAQGPLPYEIRAYKAPYPATTTLADLTWNQSNLRKRFVCGACGYSSGEAGNCPDVWNLHPGAPVGLTNLAAGAAARPERIVNVTPWNMPAAQSDLMWYDYDTGSVFYRAVVGLPFHPETSRQAGATFDPPDPRGYGKELYLRAAVQLGTNGIDLDGNGSFDILPDARFRYVIRWPAWPSVTVPVDRTAAESPGGWVSHQLQLDAQGILDGTTLNVPEIPAGSYGIGRIYLEWRNPGEPGNNWHFNVTPDNETVAPLSAAFYVSRLQIPTGPMMDPPIYETWRNGGGPGVVGPVERPGSYLARALLGPLVGGVRNDLYSPGSTTLRRPLTVINRDDQKMVERLELAPLESLTTAPGLRAGGRDAARPSLPESALLAGPTGTAGSSVAARAVDNSHWLQARIPTYQAASEPGATLGHTPDNNWGYRGLTLLFADPNSNGRWNRNLSANLDSNGDMVDEFAVFDAQVSVHRQALLASARGASEPGRVAPGVPVNAPDTTVGTPPPGRFPYPANVALRDPFMVSNEGNVVAPVTLVGPNQATAEPVGVSAKYRSLGRLLTANPLWLPLMPPYSTLSTGTLPAGWKGDAAGWGVAGLSGMGSANNPIPLGQGTGQYGGQVVHFLDVNGNGQLDFINSLNGMVSNTGNTSFDPFRDEPLEPMAFVPTALRVTESRLPYNDYYAADTEPTLRFDYGAGGVANLQVMWVSNRASVALGGGNVNVAAPAGIGVAQAAQPSFPGNILFANATAVAGGGDYRPFVWDVDARNLTGTTVAANPGSVNASPETFNDLSGRKWALWHRSLRQGAGVSSTLQSKSSNGVDWPGAESFIYASGLPKQGLRGFADPAGGGLWLFWTEGDQGHQTIHYRWNYTGAADHNEALVPLTNGVTPEWRSDVINDFASGEPMRKPSTGPFVYAKDPTAFLWTDPRGAGGVGTQVHVVFSAYVARQQNEDICWAAFDQATMNDPASNFGKLTFPRVINNPVLPATSATTRAGEQLVGDGLRQSFSSRHLDWLTTPTLETSPLSDARDPRFYLGLIFSNAPAAPALYSISWGAGTYNRARGVYVFTPVFRPLGGAPALPAAVETVPGSGILRNPLSPGGAGSVPVPLTMQLEPSTGTVTFSGPLFNPANRSDIGAAFNRTIAGLGNLVNVALYADYTPFIFRVTTSDAADDSPNAFAEVDANDPNQLRLVFLWRRSYSQKDTPNFGRTDFMYKTWTLGTQVAAGPITAGPVVSGWTGGGWSPALTAGQTGDYTVNARSGIISMVADGYRTGNTTGVFWLQSSNDGARLRIAYNGLVEEHRIIGWSQETPAPVDTVQNEGPLRVAPEIYTVSAGGGNTMPTVRYWLIWSSPRPIYDLRLVASVLHQSSDVYLGTVVPRYGAALREQEVEWQNVQQ